MKCYEVKKQLPEYLKGETFTINYIGVRKHLDECQQCAEELAKEQALNTLLDELSFPMPDIDISSQVMKSINEDRPKQVRLNKKQKLTLVQDLVSAAAVAIIAFSVIFSSMEDFTLPDYSSKVSSFSGKISEITESYLNLTDDSINMLNKGEGFKIFQKELKK